MPGLQVRLVFRTLKLSSIRRFVIGPISFVEFVCQICLDLFTLLHQHFQQRPRFINPTFQQSRRLSQSLRK